MAGVQPLHTEKSRLNVDVAPPKGEKAGSSRTATMCKIALPRTLRNPVLHKKTQLSRTNDWTPLTSDCFYLRTLEAESGSLYDGPDFLTEQVYMSVNQNIIFVNI
jgi:hypothetical protein